MISCGRTSVTSRNLYGIDSLVALAAPKYGHSGRENANQAACQQQAQAAQYDQKIIR
jgi:hypothetical protein